MRLPGSRHSIVWAILAFMSLLFTAFVAVGKFINDQWRDEAEERGHAEYYLDDENNRQWRWKDCE